jgi:hypothetical protein
MGTSSLPTFALAASIASRSEQSASQVPSLVSVSLVTVKVVANGLAGSRMIEVIRRNSRISFAAVGR